MYPDINYAFISSLKFLWGNGRKLTIRAREVQEITDYSFSIANPTKRFLTCPFRYNNPMATAAELLWVMSGRNDVDFLKIFLPNAPDFSDNGKMWSGAYGPRLRWFNSAYNRTRQTTVSMRTSDYDQIKAVVKALKNDKYSRQAIIVISQPDMDYDPEIKTNDRPCTVFVQFMIRKDQLDCYVRMRSNDIIWGCFNINVFEWTFLQEIIAGTLGVKIGNYHHNAVSFHVYEAMYKRVDKILKATPYNVYSDEPATVEISGRQIIFDSIKHFYYYVDEFLEIIETTIKNPYNDEIDDLYHATFSFLPLTARPFIIYLNLPLSYIYLTNGDYEMALKFLCLNFSHLNPDGLIAGLEYMIRHIKKNADSKIYDYMTKKITKTFSFSEETFNFILGNW